MVHRHGRPLSMVLLACLTTSAAAVPAKCEEATNRPPALRVGVAPVFPEGRPEVCSVEVSIEVGEDGLVESASAVHEISCTDENGFPLKGTSPQSKAERNRAFEEAALAAVRGRIYRPAMRDGKPVRARVTDTIRFEDPIIRQVFAVPYDKLGPRIDSALDGAFEESKRVPDGGFLIRLPTREWIGRPAAVGLSLRYGPEPDGKSTWIAAEGIVLVRSKDPSSDCDCSWFLTARKANVAEGVLTWLSLRLGIKPTSASRLVQATVTGPSSGLPEDVGGEWSYPDYELARMLETALGGNAFAPRRDSPPVPLTPVMDPPERVRKIHPAYPEVARKAKISGVVVLTAVIDRQGNVQGIRARFGNPQLIPAAAEAVCCWKYKPARMNGEPIPIYFMVQVDFTLNK